MVRTLFHRVDLLVTQDQDKKRELEHVKQALKANDYKTWTFNIPSTKKQRDPNTEKDRKNNISVAIPYIRGLSEKLTHIFREHGVNTYHKPFNTLRSILVHPKDKTDTLEKCGVIYKITCPDCHQTYIGETARQLNTRLKEHTKMKAPLTAVGEHCVNHQHRVTKENIEIIGNEPNYWRRKIRESVEIRLAHPDMNRDEGYDLPPIYKELFHMTPHQRGSCDERV